MAVYVYIKNHGIRILFAALIAAAFAGTVIYIFGSNLLAANSDSCAYNIWTREVVREHSLVPRTFYHSTDSFMWHISVPMALLWHFVPNQLLLRALGVLILFGVSCAVIWFVSKYVFKTSPIIMWLIYLLCPASGEIVSMLWEQAAYLQSAIFVLLVPALFCFAADENLEIISFTGKSNRIRIALYSLIFILIVLASTATIALFVVPMLGALMIMFVADNHKELPQGSIKRVFKSVLYVIVPTLLGLLFYHNFFGKYGIAAKTPVIGDSNQLIDSFNKFLPSILEIFNFPYNTRLVSAVGVIGLLKVAIGIVITVVLPISLLFKYKELSGKVRFFTLSIILENVIALTVVILGGYFIEGSGRRMLTPGMVGLWILSGYYITGYMLQKPVVARTIVIVLFAVSALIYVPSRYHSLDNYEQRSANLHDITNFLEAEGLTFGYAGFWNANINTVLSDYKVEIAQVYAGGGKLNPHKWLASTHYFEPDYHSGETFVMLTRDEYAQYGADLVGYGTPKEILEHGNYIISVYDYNISINDFNGRLYDDSSDLPDNGITENFPYTAGVALQCGVLNDTDGSFETDGTNGCVMFGPYAPVKTGIYNFTLHYEVLNNPNGDEVVGVFDVAQNPGVNIVGQVNISAAGNAVKIENLSFSDAAENFEHRVTISNGAVIRIYKIDIEKVGEELKQTEYGRYIISLAEGNV